MLTVKEQEIISERLKTDPSVFPSSWTIVDVLSAIQKDAEKKLNLDTFIECLKIEEELELAELSVD